MSHKEGKCEGCVNCTCNDKAVKDIKGIEVEQKVGTCNCGCNTAEEKKILGYCKECGSAVYNSDECLPDYPGGYQCSVCSHPNRLDELWCSKPSYIK